MDSINTNETIELADLEPNSDVSGGGKELTGTIILNSVNTYTGATTVQGGTLSDGSRQLNAFVVEFDRPIDQV